jgi:hypothetical protein
MIIFEVAKNNYKRKREKGKRRGKKKGEGHLHQIIIALYFII